MENVARQSGARQASDRCLQPTISTWGREAIETYLLDIRETWEELRVLVDEFRDLGDRVLMLGRMEGRGRGSGVPVDAPQGIIYDFRGGKISRLRGYLDHGEALRAAGLAEKGR